MILTIPQDNTISVLMEHSLQESLESVLGALAMDIRHDWSYDVNRRIDLMIILCQDLKRTDWAEELEESREDICSDGRVLRDWHCYCMTTRQDLDDALVDTTIFNCPESVMYDYVG